MAAAGALLVHAQWEPIANGKARQGNRCPVRFFTSTCRLSISISIVLHHRILRDRSKRENVAWMELLCYINMDSSVNDRNICAVHTASYNHPRWLPIISGCMSPSQHQIVMICHARLHFPEWKLILISFMWQPCVCGKLVLGWNSNTWSHSLGRTCSPHFNFDLRWSEQTIEYNRNTMIHINLTICIYIFIYIYTHI